MSQSRREDSRGQKASSGRTSFVDRRIGLKVSQGTMAGLYTGLRRSREVRLRLGIGACARLSRVKERGGDGAKLMLRFVHTSRAVFGGRLPPVFHRCYHTCCHIAVVRRLVYRGRATTPKRREFWKIQWHLCSDILLISSFIFPNANTKISTKTLCMFTPSLLPAPLTKRLVPLIQIAHHLPPSPV